MRVTFGSIFRNGLVDINKTAADLVRRQNEVSSGRRIHVPSDDPAAMAIAMGERAEMATLDHFKQTSDSVESRLLVVDSVYTDVIRRLENVQTKAAAGRNSFLTQVQRDALAVLLEEATTERRHELVLLDPPYERWEELEERLGVLVPPVVAERGLVVVETDAALEPTLPLALRTTRRYGSARLTLFDP